MFAIWRSCLHLALSCASHVRGGSVRWVRRTSSGSQGSACRCRVLRDLVNAWPSAHSIGWMRPLRLHCVVARRRKVSVFARSRPRPSRWWFMRKVRRTGRHAGLRVDAALLRQPAMSNRSVRSMPLNASTTEALRCSVGAFGGVVGVTCAGSAEYFAMQSCRVPARCADRGEPLASHDLRAYCSEGKGREHPRPGECTGRAGPMRPRWSLVKNLREDQPVRRSNAAASRLPSFRCRPSLTKRLPLFNAEAAQRHGDCRVISARVERGSRLTAFQPLERRGTAISVVRRWPEYDLAIAAISAWPAR